MHASTHLARRLFAARTRRRLKLLQRLAAPEARFRAQLVGWAILASLPLIMLIALSLGAGTVTERAATPVPSQSAQR